MTSHDTEILAAVRRGQRDALIQYIELSKPSVMAFINKRVGGHLRRKLEPDDIFQEVSLEAVRSLEKVDLSQREPIQWLFQISERKIIDAHRKYFASQKRDASREASIPDGSQAAGGLANLLVASLTTPSEAFSRDQKQLRMLAALDTLPETQREALRMRYLVGLPSKEIAAKLGKTDGAVRVMLSRGLSRLQELLADGPDAPQPGQS